MSRSALSAVLLFCIIYTVSAACPGGYYGEVSNSGYCRWKYKGPFGYGTQERGEFGTGGPKPLQPYTIKRNDTDVVEDFANNYVKTKYTLYSLNRGETGPVFGPAITIPSEFRLIGKKYVLLANGTVFKLENDKISYLIPQPPVTCVDMISLQYDQIFCLASTRMLYLHQIAENGTAFWSLFRDMSSVPNSSDLKLVLSEQDTSTYGLISNGIVYMSGKEYNNSIVSITALTNVSYVALHQYGDFNVSISATAGIYVWGVFSKTYTAPTLFLEDVKIVSVKIEGTSGLTSSIYAISDTGVAYGFGWNPSGWLADGTTINRVEPIASSLVSEKCFGFFSGILIYQSRIEFWNLAYNTQRDFQPMAAHTFDSRVSKIVSMNDQTFVLTEAGTIYGMGANPYGGLGDGSKIDSNIPVPFGKTEIYGKKVTTFEIGVGVTDENKLFIWGNAFLLCTSPMASIKTPRILTTLNANYTIFGQIGNHHAPRVLINNTILDCGRTLSILPNKNVIKIGSFASDNIPWVVTSDGDLMILGIQNTQNPKFLRLCKTMQEGNCTISDLHRNYFAPTDVYRIGEYMQTITSDTNILFVCNDGRSFLYFNGTYTPFEKMDNTVHTGSPDVYVTQNGTILHAYFPNSGLKKLERTADFPRVLSVGTTFNGFVGLYAICSEYFIGASCEIPVCNGVPANETRVCSGQGTCVRPNTCLCNSNYRGLYCDQQVTTCNTGLSIAVVALSVALALALFFILLIFVVLCVVQYRVSKNKKQRLAQESLSMNLLDQDFKDQASLHQQ